VSRKRLIAAWRVLVWLIGAAACPLTVVAAEAQPTAGAAPSGVFEELVRKQTDATLGALVREGRSSFAVAILVRDGSTQFARTYGLENPWSQTPFSVDSTLVDLNSIEKLFIAVAIAQLVEQRVIGSIDDPVNRYLKHYQLPDAFGHAVTIRELATHSAGFNGSELGPGPMAADPPRFFQKRFPGYFSNPGHHASYDEFGPYLLAYMVSELTGMPFARYVEGSILRPLGMSHTFLGVQHEPFSHRVVAFQPKSPRNMATPIPLKPVDAALADGPAIASAGDMAKFMIALLAPPGAQAVITPSMRALIFQVYQSEGDWGGAHALLFSALRTGEHVIFHHGGIGPGIACEVTLDLTRDSGTFFCYGSARAQYDRVNRWFNHDPALLPPDFVQIQKAMQQPFLDCTREPVAGCPRYPPPVWTEDWKRYLGLYVASAGHHRGTAQFFALLYPRTMAIERNDGSLRFNGITGYVEIAPGSFGGPGLAETFSFIPDAAGELVLSGSEDGAVFARPHLLDNPRVWPRMLAVLVALAMSGGLLVLAPRHRPDILAGSSILLYGSVLGCGLAAIYIFHAFQGPYFTGVLWPLIMLRVTAFLTIPACARLLINAYRISQKPRVGITRFGKMHFNLICISSILMVACLMCVGLISFSPFS